MIDGRPFNTDIFLCLLLDHVRDAHDIRAAMKDWVEGDWRGALQDIPAHVVDATKAREGDPAAWQRLDITDMDPVDGDMAIKSAARAGTDAALQRIGLSREALGDTADALDEKIADVVENILAARVLADFRGEVVP